MEENKQTNENLKYALCYVPFVAFILYYIEKNKSAILEKHIRYGMVIFGIYIILLILVSWLFKGLLGFLYIGVSIFLGYKTYIGEEVQIKFIDDFFNKSK
ncbi:MAG: hypothetical protein PHH98_03105 [Candidatus Gracilibacteria bacterium]|nr:hypothetical protein [Candidatus Gracilibacteria bacterium]